MSKTRTQLKNQALTFLHVIGAGQEAEAEDMETIEALVDPLIEQLASDRICYVPDTEAIDLDIFIPLAKLLANVAAPSFSQQYSEEAKAIFEAQLRRMTASRPSYETLVTEYF